jgi:hypothetical protein
MGPAEVCAPRLSYGLRAKRTAAPRLGGTRAVMSIALLTALGADPKPIRGPKSVAAPRIHTPHDSSFLSTAIRRAVGSKYAVSRWLRAGRAPRRRDRHESGGSFSRPLRRPTHGNSSAARRNHISAVSQPTSATPGGVRRTCHTARNTAGTRYQNQ